MRNNVIRVATDGSPGSRRALEWALAEAELRSCAVELVTAYDPEPGTDRDAARVEAETTIHQTMDDIVAGRVDLPAVSWHVVQGETADVLIRESEHSDLLVMGSHGVSSLRHSSLGSVADLCARMAACPVVILPSHGPAAKAHDDLLMLGHTYPEGAQE